jgi:hypothetical protein
VRRAFLKILGFGGVAATIAGCSGGNNWKQKLTVTVQTPHGLVSGSSVSEVSYTFREDWGGFFLGDKSMYSGQLRGEAVVVDLGSGRYVFALRDERQLGLAYEVFYPRGTAPKELRTSDPMLYSHFGQANKTHANEIELSRKSAVLAPELYPVLITFGNINDPSSVRLVNPRNLAALFGTGFGLNSIELAIVDSTARTEKIVGVLPWINSEADLMKFWKALVSSGFKGNVEIRSLFSRS